MVGSIVVIIYMVKVKVGLDWLRSIITSVIVIIVSGVIARAADVESDNDPGEKVKITDFCGRN